MSALLCTLMIAIAVLVSPMCVTARAGQGGGASRPNAVLAGVTIYGLTSSNQIVTFDSSAPQTPILTVGITGLSPGDVPLAIDVRPATEQLYMLVNPSKLFVVDPATGVATHIGDFGTALVGNEFGFDFNPTVDRIRVVSDSLQNLRLNPDTGQVAGVDTSLAYDAADPFAGVVPHVTAAAYSNNFPFATTTTLYDIDTNLDNLVIQNPPNNGTLTTVGSLGVDASDLAGLDIATRTGTAFAAFQVPGVAFPRLYSINLGTGLATEIGVFGGTSPVRDIAVAVDLKRGADTPGVYDSTGAAWFLRNTNSSGVADITFSYGPGGALKAIKGDFDGDGTDTPGVYDGATGTFFLRNSNSGGSADLTFPFGAPAAGYVPLAGDWNGDGVDTIGLYSPTTGVFFLRNQNSGGVANLSFAFGAANAGFVPITGDWNGDGIDTIGLYAPATGVFFLRNTNSAGPADLAFSYGGPGAVPVVGDFDNNTTDTVGIYVPATGTFFLKFSNASGNADLAYGYGPANLVPLVGDWNGL